MMMMMMITVMRFVSRLIRIRRIFVYSTTALEFPVGLQLKYHTVMPNSKFEGAPYSYRA